MVLKDLTLAAAKTSATTTKKSALAAAKHQQQLVKTLILPSYECKCPETAATTSSNSEIGNFVVMIQIES